MSLCHVVTIILLKYTDYRKAWQLGIIFLDLQAFLTSSSGNQPEASELL